MKPVSCVTHLSCVQPVINAQLAAQNLPVGARLQHFWQNWLDLGAGPKAIQILKEGYTLPFRTRPKLTRSPTVISCYVNPHRDSYLLKALHQLIAKNAVELVRNQKSLGFFNRLFLVPKPNNKWRPILDLSNLNVFLKVEKFKMETPETIRASLHQGEWVTSIDFRDAYFHIPIHSRTIQEVSQVSYPKPDIPVQGSALWSLNGTLAIHCDSQRSETNGHTQGYKDPPVPRLLVGESQIPPGLSPTYSDPSTNVPGSRLDGELGKVRTATQTNLRICRLPVRPHGRSSPTDTGPVAEPPGHHNQNSVFTGLSGQTVHVLDRSLNSHRKTSSPRQTAYETHTMAPQKQLARTRISTKSDSNSQISASSLKMVASRRQRSHRPTITPHKTCSANLYRRIKRRVGRSLKRTHCKRFVVPTGKQPTHKLPGIKSSAPSTEGIPGSLLRTDSTGGKKFIPFECNYYQNRQHYSSVVHQQGGRNEVGPALCFTMENVDLVYQTSGHSQSPTYTRQAERGSRQVISTRPDNSNRIVSPPRDFPGDMRQVAPARYRPIRHEVQQQVTSVRFTSTGHTCSGSGCTQSSMGGNGCLCLPTSSHLGQGGGEITGLPLQENHSDCSRMAQHALVLGSCDHVQSDPTEPAQPTQSADPAFQPDPSQKSDKPESPCMAPRATAIKKQGFSETVAARIEAPQRGSTRSVYEAKWTIFTKWCNTNQVDFRAPPLKSIADFLMYLFEDRKLQPCTIDGYRSAIADKLGRSTLNVSKDENLTRLLESFHRDRPKGRRGIPSWNLSLVLHQLTKAPFEPASLKHLTFKTVFLLALGSGKRRSEIHAWLNRNIRHQSDWSKVSLYPSPSFLSKNQLAKEGPDSVAPVVIPALAPTLDKSLKSDRSLCPVRALRYYLDRTSDIRQNKELVFVSFKKGFDKDISPATISSWIKQTVILCYELSDQQAHTLHQVKAHDVRAFAASKAFQSGFSLDQILSACHWKSHNTFTQFYLKDVAWADSELYHLGPVVAAQQIHK